MLDLHKIGADVGRYFSPDTFNKTPLADSLAYHVVALIVEVGELRAERDAIQSRLEDELTYKPDEAMRRAMAGLKISQYWQQCYADWCHEARAWARIWKRAAKVNRFTLIQSGKVNDSLQNESADLRETLNETASALSRLQVAARIARDILVDPEKNKVHEWRYRAWFALDEALSAAGQEESCPR